MKVIPKLQRGNTIEPDNTKVVRPEVHEAIKAKPRQYSFVDLGGEPSNDDRSAAERNKDYWHPVKGAKERFKSSMKNNTNPLVGIERTILPSAAGAALVTTPAAVVGGALGNMTVDKLTGGWGEWLEDKTGLPSEIGVYTNPGTWYGGIKGHKVGKLSKKFVFGDEDLGWNPLINSKYFKRYSKIPIEEGGYYRVTSNNEIAAINKSGKLQVPDRSYYDTQTARLIADRLKITPEEVLTLDSKNPKLLDEMFNAAPKPKGTLGLRPRRKSNHGDVAFQKEGLFYDSNNPKSPYYGSPTIKGSQSKSKFQEGHHGKEAEPVMRMGDKEFMTFRQPGTDYIGSIDDVAGHLVKFQMNKGKLRQTSQDMWKFNPADYAKRWNDSPTTANQVRLIKQAALMDKVGRPFILQQSNPIWIEGKSVRNPELVTMAHGGRFDFKKSPLLKKQEEINGKRDMRKKFIKSSRPTYKKRIKKAQQGMKFVSYNPVSNPTIDYTDITNPINPFSEYNYNTTYDKPEALVVPVRDTDETDVVANNPTVEPVINKPVASKVTYTPKSYKGLAAFNKAYDEVEASNPEAKKYRQFLTKMAEQESGFNSAIQNRAGAPAYGYFQFMQDDKKYNNIRQYAGTDIETFRSNPKLQIEAAIKLAKSFEKGFSKEDLELANKNGYSTWGLLGGAWLAGNGGVRKFLRGQGNPSDRHWSKEGKGTDVATRIKAFNFKEGGMIVKYQEPAHGISRRDATYVAPKMYAPRPYKTEEEKARERQPNSEIVTVPAKRGIDIVNGKLQMVDTPARQIPNVGAGYLSGTDPIGEFIVGNVVAGKPLMWLGKGLQYSAAKAGSQWARARVISKTIDKGTPSVEPLPNNVGWGPRQSIHVVHDKNSARLPKLYFPERWDAIHEGAPEVGIWYQGKFGNPRTAANHSIPGKAEKAAKARERFAKRPYRVEGDLELERPIVTVGDVPNRAALERAADKMSADGVVFNNVYDNGYSNNQVIFSLRDNLKNGTMTHKPTGKIVTPTENNPYPKIGTATIVNGKFEPTGDIFGEILPTQGTKQAVFHHKTDPTKVVKVSKVPEEGYRTVDELRKAIKMSRARDEVPSAVPTELQGYLQGEKGMYPVFTQTKVGPIEKMSVLDELAKIFESKGWTRINDSSYKNSRITVGDITTENVGMLNGKPVIFDPEAAYNEDIIKVSNAKFKNK